MHCQPPGPDVNRRHATLIVLAAWVLGGRHSCALPAALSLTQQEGSPPL